VSGKNEAYKELERQILSRLNIRAEAELLGVRFTKSEPNARGWLPCYSPFRDEEKPSAAICVDSPNGELGMCTDKGGTEPANGFFEWTGRKLGIDYKESRARYAVQVGVALSPATKRTSKSGKPEKKLERIDAPEAAKLRIEKFCALKPPIAPDSVAQFGGFAANYWRGRCIAFPLFKRRDCEKPCGHILRPVDAPEFPEYTFKTGKRKGETAEATKVLNIGSTKGWTFNKRALDVAERIWLTEGEPDALTLAGRVGLLDAVVTNGGGTGNVAGMDFSLFKGLKVALVGHNDDPGASGIKKFAEEIAKVADEVRIVPLQLASDKGKDVRDFFNAGGTFEELEAAYAAAVPLPKGEKSDSEPEPDARQLEPGDDEEGDDLSASEVDPMDWAKMFVAGFTVNNQLQLRYYREEFWIWNGASYKTVRLSEIRARLHRKIAASASHVTTKVIANVMAAVTAITIVPGENEMPCWLDLDDLPPHPPEEMISSRRGLFHLPSFISASDRSEVVMQPTPRFFTANALDFDFDPLGPPVSAPLWLKFLSDVLPNDPVAVQLIQEWFGYNLLPNTRLQKILMLVGLPRSGKGTIGRILGALLGKANVAGPSASSLAGDFGLSGLIGKLAAIIPDARLSGRDTQGLIEKLLSISGEDLQTINRKHLPVVEMILKVRLTVLTNELPKLPDSSGAAASRFLIVHFTQSFINKEDEGLTDRLKAELPGIFWWALEGLKRLLQRGRFMQPKSGEELAKELSDLSSPVKAFVRDCCKTDPHKQVKKDDLYAAWKAYCLENGKDHPGDNALFGRNLMAAVNGVRAYRSDRAGERTQYYAGIELDPDRQGSKLSVRMGNKIFIFSGVEVIDAKDQEPSGIVRDAVRDRQG